MKFLLSYIFYIIGDFISKTIMQWFNGSGYSIYSALMNWSVYLDEEDKIWKPVKANKKRNRLKKK